MFTSTLVGYLCLRGASVLAKSTNEYCKKAGNVKITCGQHSHAILLHYLVRTGFPVSITLRTESTTDLCVLSTISVVQGHTLCNPPTPTVFPSSSHTEQPFSPLNCFMLGIRDFPGRSADDSNRVALITLSWPLGVTTVRPDHATNRIRYFKYYNQQNTAIYFTCNVPKAIFTCLQVTLFHDILRLQVCKPQGCMQLVMLVKCRNYICMNIHSPTSPVNFNVIYDNPLKRSTVYTDIIFIFCPQFKYFTVVSDCLPTIMIKIIDAVNYWSAESLHIWLFLGTPKASQKHILS